jgi:uncharacterized protein (TIGR02001 family)
MKTSMIKSAALGVLAMSCIAPVAQAADASGPFSGGVALTSDYRFRGVSQSDRNPAVQGWAQYDHASGAFANLWLSTIDFNDETSYDSSVEVDLTAGYNFKLGENTGASVKAVYYWYADADTPPGAPDYDYWEFAVGATHDYGKVSVKAELAYSPEFFAETGDAWALSGGASVPITDSFLFFTGGLTASANLGHQWIDVGTDYLFYDLGVSTSWKNISLDLRWVDTDLSEAQCPGTDWCEGGVVVTLSAAFPG